MKQLPGRAVFSLLLKVLRKLARSAGLRRAAWDPAWPQVDTTPAEIDPASAPIESIYQHAVSSSARIVGLTGVTGDSGVSSLARALARRAWAGGQRALLIDASSLLLAPTSERAPVLVDEGHYRLELRPSADEMLPLREVSRLRNLISDFMREFEFIVVDMPPVLGGEEHPLPATVVANACDTMMLVCMTGQMTHVDLRFALRRLDGANAKPAGVIVNHREQPTLGAEIAREAERIRRFAPRFAERIQRRMIVSKFFDVHA